MSSNRLAGFLTELRLSRFSFETAARQQTKRPQQAFVVCPLSLVSGATPSLASWQMSIHQLAYERAKATLAARRRARDLAARWN